MKKHIVTMSAAVSLFSQLQAFSAHCDETAPVPTSTPTSQTAAPAAAVPADSTEVPKDANVETPVKSDSTQVEAIEVKAAPQKAIEGTGADSNAAPDRKAAAGVTSPSLNRSAPKKSVSENLSDPSSQTKGWSIGVGVSFFSYAGGSLLTQSEMVSGRNLGGFSWSPGLSLCVEKRITRSLYLLFDVEGAYQWSSSSSSDAQAPKEPDYESGSAGVELGIRPIFNPGKFIEVSAIVTIGAGWRGNNSGSIGYFDGEDFGLDYDYVYLDYQSSGIYVDGTIGIAFEKELTKRLFLRFQSSLVGMQFNRTAVNEERIADDSYEIGVLHLESVDTKNRAFGVGFSFSPTIQLRMLL
jgi:hypothetical protein